MKAHLLKKLAVVAGVFFGVATFEPHSATAVDFSFTKITDSREVIGLNKFRQINSGNYDKISSEFIARNDVNFIANQFTSINTNVINLLSVVDSQKTPSPESDKEVSEEIMELTGNFLKTMSASVQETTKGVIGEEIERTDARIYLILILVILWMRLR